MKTLLIAPSKRPEVAHLANGQPLAVAALLGESLVVHWIEFLAEQGTTEIQILAADYPEALRAVTGDGGRWGVKIEIHPVGTEPTAKEAALRYRSGTAPGWSKAPYDVVVMNHLPGHPNLSLFESYSSWFAGVLSWMPHALTPARVRMSQQSPGIWISRRAYVAKSAVLTAPCWIGDQVFVGAGASIGEGSILEDRSVVERGARVIRSIVAPDTFVGRLTYVADSLALGSTLVNWKSGSILQVPDPFLMCSLNRDTRPGATTLRYLSAFARKVATPFGLSAILPLPLTIIRALSAHRNKP